MNKTLLALLLVGGLFGCSDDESTTDGAAGSAGSSSESPFGATCDTAADCTAPTNYCAAPPMQSKFCTQTMASCDEAPTTCPEGWSCLDLNAFGLPAIICERPAGS